MLCSSQRSWFVQLFPTWAPPPLNAFNTLMAGSVLSPSSVLFNRMYCKRVSLMALGFRTAVSVSWTVCDVEPVSIPRVGSVKSPMPEFVFEAWRKL